MSEFSDYLALQEALSAAHASLRQVALNKENGMHDWARINVSHWANECRTDLIKSGWTTKHDALPIPPPGAEL